MKDPKIYIVTSDQNNGRPRVIVGQSGLKNYLKYKSHIFYSIKIFELNYLRVDVTDTFIEGYIDESKGTNRVSYKIRSKS